MRIITHLYRWLVFSNVFIALCAVLMSWQTAYLLGVSMPKALLPFVFFATLCSYSFHWFLSFDAEDNSGRILWLKKYRNLHLALLIISFFGVVVYAWPLLANWEWLLLSAFVTFLYSAPKIPHPLFRSLRKVAYGKTIFLALVWTWVTTMLPVALSDAHFTPAFWWLFIGRFFLIYAICILFDYRDRDYDRSIGIRSLITWLNERQIAGLFIFSLIIFLCSTLFLYHWLASVSLLVQMLVPGILTALTYTGAVRSRADMLYYAWLDGLMAFSSLTMWLLYLIKS